MEFICRETCVLSVFALCLQDLVVPSTFRLIAGNLGGSLGDFLRPLAHLAKAHMPFFEFAASCRAATGRSEFPRLAPWFLENQTIIGVFMVEPFGCSESHSSGEPFPWVIFNPHERLSKFLTARIIKIETSTPNPTLILRDKIFTIIAAMRLAPVSARQVTSQ